MVKSGSSFYVIFPLKGNGLTSSIGSLDKVDLMGDNIALLLKYTIKIKEYRIKVWYTPLERKRMRI